MSIKLGNTTASLYLGSTPVAAYLGAEQVYSAVQAVTLYFNGAVDSDWAEVGNWWLDAGHTEPAGRLPTSDESVVVSANVTASGQTVVNFTISGSSDLFGTLTVTDNATFGNGAGNSGTVTGNATFQNGSGNYGHVTGTATFEEGSCDNGGTAGTFVPDPPPECP
jgi:hypothetical protein